jgi:hypothetical protein
MRYVLRCEDESSDLSNSHDLDIWEALESLARILAKDTKLSQEELLHSWKTGHHLATARETYGWRDVMEEIKNADLPARCVNLKRDPKYTLIIDKPAMLKIAGEIANALLHSYTKRHKVSYQAVSKEPSGVAL